MRLEISDYPGSYLAVCLEKDEQIIAEKGSLIFADGEYFLETKVEAKSYKNWIAKVFGGKSLFYNVYIAKEKLQLALSTKDSSELFLIEVTNDNPILFEPNMHFARTKGLDFVMENKNWKNTLSDGIKLKTQGEGKLFLKGYGKIIQQEINSEKPVFIDEEALIAFEEKLAVKTISRNMKELVTSGEGFLFSVSGTGKIWLQTREKSEGEGSGGVLDGIFSFLK